ncbi:MAG: hypothetical protein Q8S73_08665 [Deltaproteobacteria bacterium]|nr:hypothetical protein [Deltaproteobacteria bacterium]
MTLGTPTTALVEPAGATRTLGEFTRGARVILLAGALATSARCRCRG